MTSNSNQPDSTQEKTGSIDERMKHLRSRISDLGSELDTDRAGIAAALGAGVFLIMLAALAAYDLYSGKAGVWLQVGIDRDTLIWIAVVLGGLGIGLLVRAIMRRRQGESEQHRELAALEQQYADLLEQKRASAEADPIGEK